MRHGLEASLLGFAEETQKHLAATIHDPFPIDVRLSADILDERLYAAFGNYAGSQQSRKIAYDNPERCSFGFQDDP
jgi:hypothetical protein